MIIPIDEQLAKKLSIDFDLYPLRRYNDYSFDISNNNSLITQISYMAYNQPDKFQQLKELIDNYKGGVGSDQLLATMGYCRYMDKEFEQGLRHISALLEYNPSNIDAWIDLCFFLAHISDGYDTYLNMRFHLYYFMHLYHAYDFQTVNKQSIAILNRLVADMARTPAVRSGYDKKISFDTEFLILNGSCNNNCETCHIPFHYRAYDFEDRITQSGLVSLSHYIFIKARKKPLRHFVLKGGEPTLHPNYFKVVRAISAVRPDVTIHVRTNARTFCNKDFVNRHAAASIKKIVFEAGIFSHDPALHDSIARVQGSQAQTLQGIRNLLDSGFQVSARVGLCHKNIDSLSDTLDFISSEFQKAPGFQGIGLVLPAPSAENLDTYYPHGIRTLRDKAAEVLAGRKGESQDIPIVNNALVEDC